eukprot:jgi/Undpi1/7911/HiC_scaffold_24.g10383.m1
MVGSSSSAAAASLPVLVGLLASFVGYLPQQAEGHAYLMSPVSRNFWATDAFQDSSYPDINYCPHCFQSRGPAAVRARAEENTDPTELASKTTPGYRNELASNGNYYEPDAIAVRHGICGDPEQTAQEGSNLFGQENANYPILETYAEGSVMEVKVVVSTYHWGHLEFFICNADDMTDPDGVVTQGCFNMHPLDRATDDGTASRIDPNHVGRYYLDPSCRASETDQSMPEGAFSGDVVTARYQLPDGLTCTRCIVQMVYYTGNSCTHPGYDEFNPSSWGSECAPTTSDWIALGVGMCGDGDFYPEEYWNCADIEITSDGNSTRMSPSSTSSTESEPTSTPETEEPAAAPTVEPTPVLATEEPAAAPSVEPTLAPDTEEPASGSTDEPTMGPETEEPASSPTTEPTPTPETPESTMYETYAPMPILVVEPMGEPSSVSKAMTLAPATFAPSVAVPTPDGECEDPVGAFAQCGGDDYDGSTCCRPGYKCTAVADSFSECRPTEGGCSEGWGQCGGNNWDGPSCCWEGAMCLERNEWYSQCVPDATP